MCVPGCIETVQRRLGRRGFIKGAGLMAAGAAALAARPLPARAAETRSFTRVVDLTHVMGPDFPTYAGSVNLEMETLVTLAKDGYNMNRWLLVEHTGTRRSTSATARRPRMRSRSSIWWCRSWWSISGPRRRTTRTRR